MDKPGRDNAGMRRHETIEYGPDGTLAGDSALPAEAEVAIMLDDEHLVTLHCTPEHLEDLARGFLLSQGFVTAGSDIIALRQEADPLRIAVTLREGAGIAAGPRPPNRVIYSGCGQDTGSAPVDAIEEEGPAGGRAEFTAAALRQALEEVLRRGELYRQTRGIHSAGIYSRDGNALVFREDIGRHNACDKVLGWLSRVDIAPGDCFIAASGRVSAEAVHKAVRFRIPVYFSKGVPTSKAVSDARRLGLTLASSLGPGRLRAYSHGYRIKP